MGRRRGRTRNKAPQQSKRSGVKNRRHQDKYSKEEDTPKIIGIQSKRYPNQNSQTPKHGKSKGRKHIWISGRTKIEDVNSIAVQVFGSKYYCIGEPE